MKKVLHAFLIFIFFLSFMPGQSVAAVSSGNAEKIMSAAQELVNAYAAQVNQPDAADEAFEDFLIHGFFNNGRDLILKESDPMVATIFNAGLMQETLVECIYRGLVKMQELNRANLFAVGAPAWHNYGYTYAMTAYQSKDDYVRGSDGTLILSSFNKRLGNICGAKYNYGPDAATDTFVYRGHVNRNDDALELLGGYIPLRMNFTRVAVKENTASYRIELRIYDDFDFNSDYDKISEKGFNTTKDQRLKNLGLLMSIVGLDEFYWEFTKDFTIEVPYECDHSGNSYHWVYDSETSMLYPDTANGFDENGVTRKEHINAEDGKVSYFFKLDKPIVLSHDKPWLVELDMKGLTTLAFSTLSSMNYSFPTLIHYGRSNTWIYSYEVTEGKNEYTISDYVLHYVGADILDTFNYSSKHNYKVLINNVPAADGSNMIYVSIYDKDIGETVCDCMPLTTHWINSKGDEARTQLKEPSYMANGIDFIINYIGNNSYRFNERHQGIYIYENGSEVLTESHFEDACKAPTCTDAGGTVQSCRDCGYSYVSSPEAALGHSYGDYISDGNANCTEDGTKTAVCIRCGQKDTAADVGSAKGHEFSATVVEPACAAGGYTSYTCHCGHSYDDAPTEALGHAWDEGSVIRRPGIDMDGEKIFTCDRCGETRSESLPGIPEAGFEDVAENDYFYESVNWAAAKGITRGLSVNEFGPASGCTRAQVVTFLWRAAGKPAPESNANPFKDVAEGLYYYDAVLWAVENGITAGLSADTFGPDTSCTRGQIVTFLWRAAGEPAAAASVPFEDVAADSYFYEAIGWAVEQEVTSGVSPTAFAPNASCTRAHIVTFLYRAEQS